MAQITNFLDDELLAKIKGIQIRANHLANDVFAGEYESAFKGRGLEFEEVREYQPGDDVRSIDWNVTARYNKPFIKTFRDERELTVLFVVDVSASARFGTQKKFKSDIAAEITALLAYTALKNNDKVGLVIFSDQVEHYLPPKKGRGPIWRLIKDILAYKSTSKETKLAAPLSFINRCFKKKTIIFLISDFLDSGFQDQLRSLARYHDLIAINISDIRERNLPAIGYIELEDMETGESILINTKDPRLQKELTAKNAEAEKAKLDFFRSARIDFIQVEANDSYFEPIVRFFRKREKRK